MCHRALKCKISLLKLNSIHVFCSHREFQALAVAGPVKANSCQVFCFELILFATHVRFQMTNLTWKIDGASLEKTFDIKSVRVMNDFEAIGYGIHELEESELLRLNNCSKKYFTSFL